jgi:hypothetical protein
MKIIQIAFFSLIFLLFFFPLFQMSGSEFNRKLFWEKPLQNFLSPRKEKDTKQATIW